MAREKRFGQRKSRECRQKRLPDLGYYLIITDTEKTEENYFTGLRNSIPVDLQNRLVIKVAKTKTENLVETTQRLAALHPQYCQPWIVFDRDRVPNFNEIIQCAEKEEIHVGWSNPCVEIWFFAYFGTIPSSVNESTVCCQRFRELFQRKLNREYDKVEENIYELLCRAGDEEKAIEIAEKRLQSCCSDKKGKPSEMYSCTTVHHLVREIRTKTSS